MKVVALIVAVLVVGGVGWAVYSLLDDEDIGSRGEAILDDPRQFVGDQVTVSGRVESFFPGAFTIGESAWGDELLIVARSPADIPEPIRQRRGRPRIEASGTVAIKQGDVELLPGRQFDPFDGKPYVAADTIEVVDAG